MRLRVGNTRLRVGTARLAVGSGSAPAPPAAATTFAVALSGTSGTVGTTQTATISPIGGAWPTGQPVALSVTGASCAVTPDSRTGSGTTPVTFGFTPSSAGTLSINAIAAGMISTGAQSYTASAAFAPTGTASRYDIIWDQSAVAPGATATGKVYPNAGQWGGGTITLTPSRGPAAQTITLPSSGNSPVSFSFIAPTAGELLVSGTNTASLHNPSPAPLTIFAASSGTAQTLSLGSQPGTMVSQRTYQQSTWQGSPSGFAGVSGVTLANGWGKVKVAISSSAPALFGRLTDADSSGATSSGGGTAISTVAQVYGAVSAGSTVTLLVPASDYCVYLDLATDSAFTNPVRVPVKFFVRDVALVITRSAWNMLWGSYAQGIPGNTAWSSYQKATGLGSQNTGNAGYESDAGGWGRANGTHTFGQYGQNYCGVGGQELGREFVTKKGTGLGILGLVPTGGDMDTFWAEDGTPCASAIALMGAADNEARYVIIESANWSNVYASESIAEYRKVWSAIRTNLFARWPSLAVMLGVADTGLYGQDGSRATGFARQNHCVTELEAADPAVVAGDAGMDWSEYYSNSGHAAWPSAVRYARAAARALLLAESPVAGGFGRGFADRFTRLASTGTLSGTVATIPFILAAGATQVVALRWQNGVSSAAGWTYTAPSSTDLRRIVAVYPGASGQFVSGSDTLITPTSVTVDNTVSPPVLRIGLPNGTTGPITVQLMVDFDRYAATDPTWFCSLFDDRDLGDGCGYGPAVRQQLDSVVS